MVSGPFIGNVELEMLLGRSKNAKNNSGTTVSSVNVKIYTKEFLFIPGAICTGCIT
jgi:hypothetical protein